MLRVLASQEAITITLITITTVVTTTSTAITIITIFILVAVADTIRCHHNDLDTVPTQ